MFRRRIVALLLALTPVALDAQSYTPGAPSIGSVVGSFTPGGFPAVLASVNADGWSAIPITPAATYSPDTTPVTTAVTRQGYDTSGNATTYVENVTLTQRVRQAYPNYATLDTTGRTALSNWITTTDSVAGVAPANQQSTLVMPPPIAAFISTDHALVTSTITVEFLAYHIMAHSQQPIPYATCTASDSVNTPVTVPATYYTNLGGTYDLAPLAGFRAAITVSGLNNAAVITVNCQAYPWAGTAILDSTGSPTRGWLPQVYYRNTATPTTYFVANTTATPAGLDTNAGTSAAPFATIAKALNAMGAAGRNGSIINLKEDTVNDATVTTFVYGSAPTLAATGNKAETLIQKDPAATGAGGVVLNGNASGTSADFTTQYVRLKNIGYKRGPGYTYTNTSGRLVFENVVNDGTNGGGFGMGNNEKLILIGGSTSNFAACQCYAATANYSVPLIRGHTLVATPSIYNTVDQYVQVASILSGVASGSNPVLTYDGTILAGMQYLKNIGPAFSIGDSTTVKISGIALVDTLVENIMATNTTSTRFSADAPVATSLSNVIIWNFTLAGTGYPGRAAMFYDANYSGAGCVGTTGSPGYCGIRNHTLTSLVGGIYQTFAIKTDMFVGVNQADTVDAPFHTGNWGVYYGTGSRDNAYLYVDGFGGVANGPIPVVVGNSASQPYAGLNTYVGTATTQRLDIWSNYKGNTVSGPVNSGTYTQGLATAGTYTLCTAVNTGSGGTCSAAAPILGWTKGQSLLPYTLNSTLTAIPATGANPGAY